MLTSKSISRKDLFALFFASTDIEHLNNVGGHLKIIFAISSTDVYVKSENVTNPGVPLLSVFGCNQALDVISSLARATVRG